jgi:hypothetical protein
VTVGTLFNTADVVVSLISGPQLVSMVRIETITALISCFDILIYYLSIEISPFYNMPGIKSIGMPEKSLDKMIKN